MKKTLMLAAGLSMLAAPVFAAGDVHDWHGLDAAHNHVMEAIKEMNKARAANHYDMAGHGAKAEALLNEAEKEIAASIEAAKAAGKKDNKHDMHDMHKKQ